MTKANAETAMLHFECLTCSMTATIVATPAGELAWLDHMENHAVKDHYRVWSWNVLELELGGDLR